MQIIQHRVNDLNSLSVLAAGLGAEIDLRTLNGKIILQHDPFLEGLELDAFLSEWVRKDRGILILNVKEDGLEAEVENRMRAFAIPEKQYFFLDCSLPTLVRRSAGRTEAPYSIRYSEYEDEVLAQKFARRVRWVWVDCFSGQVPPIDEITRLSMCFLVCLVSPELQGYPIESTREFSQLVPYLSAVCTKSPELWKQHVQTHTRSHSSLLQRSEESL